MYSAAAREWRRAGGRFAPCPCLLPYHCPLERFIRPVCLQDMPDRLLPPALQDANPLGLERIVEGVRGRH